MKPTILTQKNVCAFLGLIMAMTILWSAKAEAKVDTFNEVIPMELKEVNETAKEMLPLYDIDMEEVNQQPTITFINKYGEIVAEFYGDKTTLKNKFKESLEKGKFITAFGNHEFYLL
ncbi:MAG: hypothetical protein ACXIUQ_20030 [Cecembia sp.]